MASTHRHNGQLPIVTENYRHAPGSDDGNSLHPTPFRRRYNDERMAWRHALAVTMSEMKYAFVVF